MIFVAFRTRGVGPTFQSAMKCLRCGWELDQLVVYTMLADGLEFRRFCVALLVIAGLGVTMLPTFRVDTCTRSTVIAIDAAVQEQAAIIGTQISHFDY